MNHTAHRRTAFVICNLADLIRVCALLALVVLVAACPRSRATKMTRWRSSGTPARPAMSRFWSFRSVMRPSLTPELNGVVMPCTTAAWYSRRALARLASAGRREVASWSSQSGSGLASRLSSMAAN
jgi:hypothetical protein